MGRYLDARVLERIDALEPLAAGLGISMAELALAWCLRSPGVASVIVGVTRREQLEQNCRAAAVAIDDDVAAQIDALFEPGTESLPPDEDTP